MPYEEAQQKVLEQAREEAQRIVERARREAEALMTELEELRKKKQNADFAREAQEAKSRLRRQLDRMEREADPVTRRKPESYTLPRPLKAGDTVTVVSLGKVGTVLSPTDKNGVTEVQIGLIRTRVKTDDLRLTEQAKVTAPKPSRTAGGITSRGLREAHTEIDLRGMMTDEGVLALDRFIDEALLNGLSQITIIHGKGTGALRAAVQQHLRTHPNIQSYRLGTFGEGEMGVTIAELKH